MALLRSQLHFLPEALKIFFLHSLQSTYHYCPVSFSNAGSSWQVGCGMAATLGFGGAVAKYMGVYKHPFRTDRVFL